MAPECHLELGMPKKEFNRGIPAVNLVQQVGFPSFCKCESLAQVN